MTVGLLRISLPVLHVGLYPDGGYAAAAEAMYVRGPTVYSNYHSTQGTAASNRGFGPLRSDE
jgi:hypothetical protein